MQPPDGDDDKKSPPTEKVDAELIETPPEAAKERQAQALRLVEGGSGLPIGGRPGRMIAISTGPLPPPAVLAEYEKVMPGLGKRIVDTFEEETKHRRQEDSLDRQKNRDLAEEESKYQGRGQTYAYRISLAALAASVLIAIFGHPAAGAIVGTVDLIGLATVFVYGRRQRNDDKPESAGE